MIRLQFLGTSSASASSERCYPACLFQIEKKRILVDCGEGTRRQLMQLSGSFRGDLHVFLTHEHADHILGIPGLVNSWLLDGGPTMITIHAPSAAYRVVLLLLQAFEKQYDKLKIEMVQPGLVFADKDIICRSFSTSHTPSSVGYTFESPVKRHFLAEVAEQLGVPSTQRKSLQEGQSIKLENGTIVSPEQVLSKEEKGIQIVFLGDATYNLELVEICRGIDALVVNSTYSEGDRELAMRHHHLTARDAGDLARLAQPKQLILTHISARYNQEQLVREAQDLFPNAAAAQDFSIFEVGR